LAQNRTQAIITQSLGQPSGIFKNTDIHDLCASLGDSHQMYRRANLESKAWWRRSSSTSGVAGGCEAMYVALAMKQPWPNCGEETSC
jgi:hypothetical protein